MLKIGKLAVNHQTNPVGVVDTPQFSWTIESDRNNVKQKNYWIQVSMSNDFASIIYDSGVVVSEQSVHIKLEDISLKSSTHYFVRVQIADDIEASDWSEPAGFICALLDSSEWTADFISAETKADADNSKGTYVRKSFDVNLDISSAIIHTTALGLYKLYVNGNKISSDELAPGWTSYNKHLTYQTYDVKDYLRKGENAIGASIGAGWYKGVMGFMGLRNLYGEQTAFLCQLVITYADGTKKVINSDNTWKGCDSPILFSEIYDGEIYDARKEMPGWNCWGFDDNSWKSVELVQFDKSVLTAQSGSKVRQIDELKPKQLIVTPEGDKVIDFGQNLTGWVRFKVIGNAGDEVILSHFEVLDAQGNVYIENLRGAKQTITYYLKGNGEEVYNPNFTFQGFQFMKIEKYPGEINLDNFTAVTVHSDMEPTGTFECSNQDINQLQHNILWGLKGNFVDIPSDCPQRNERLGWTGDAQIFCRTSSYLMNTYTFFSKWLMDVAADQNDEGGVPHLIPDIISDGRSAGDWLVDQGTHSAAAWADVAIINPWTLYLTYGDTKILKQQYESMKAWMGFMQDHSEGIIWNYQLQFGDWVALDAKEGSYFGATPNDLTCTAFYANSALLMAKTASVLGKKADAKKYNDLYKEIVKGFQEEFFTPTGRLAARTQTAHIIVLYFNLVPEKFRERTVKTLLKLLEENDGHLVTGFVGTPYFCHALSQNGHAKEAYDLLLKDDFPSWLYQVKAGATTVWEHWDGLKPDGTMWSADMNSFNHYAYGAIGEWLYRVVAGIEIDENEPGYKHSIIHPHIGGGLDFVKAKFVSVYGDITVNWEVKGNNVVLKVTVPHNTTATIILEDAKSVEKNSGIAFALKDEKYTATVGSGDYSIFYLI